MIELLVECGADIEARSNDGSTPLIIQAAEAEGHAAMEALLDLALIPRQLMTEAEAQARLLVRVKKTKSLFCWRSMKRANQALSQRPQASRQLLAHLTRRLGSWLIYNVRSVISELCATPKEPQS